MAEAVAHTADRLGGGHIDQQDIATGDTVIADDQLDQQLVRPPLVDHRQAAAEIDTQCAGCRAADRQRVRAGQPPGQGRIAADRRR